MTRARASSLLAIAACLALAGWFAWRGERFIAANGPTFDEAVHLASGYGCWKAAEYRLNHEDPPLLKLAMSLPLVLTDSPPFPHGAATGPAAQWQAGAALVYDSGLEPRAVINQARRVNLGFGCALVLLAGWVAYRVWGSKLAAVAACGFAASDPTLLAMSAVVKTDVGVSLFSLATCYLVWEYVANPTRGLLVALGVSAGLMLATKLSAVGIAAGLALAGVVFLARGGRLALPGKSESESRLRAALELALRLGSSRS